jgi:hypothetical protein
MKNLLSSEAVKVNNYFERTHPNIKKVLSCLQKRIRKLLPPIGYVTMILKLEGEKERSAILT